MQTRTTAQQRSKESRGGGCHCAGAKGSGGCPKCAAKRAVQRSATASAATGPSRAPNDVVAPVLSQPGQPLAGEHRALLERRLGHDFSRIRLHTDEPAQRSAAALGASAYTVGRHLVFGAGRFAPATPAGRALLVHEATHALQQAFASAVPPALTMSTAGDATEREAERVAAGAGTAQGRAGSAGAVPVHIARAPCLSGETCPAQIPGANDQTATGQSELEKNEAELKKKGQTTWEFSRHYRRLAQRLHPNLVDVPTAWLIAKGSPWKAFAGRCPDDLLARDDLYESDATGQRGAGNKPDHCIFVSLDDEAGAKQFLDDPTATKIGKQSRAEWEQEAQLVIAHEAAHVPVRREVERNRSAGRYPSLEAARVDAGPLNELAGVLAELPLIYDQENARDPATAVGRIRDKIHGPNPPGSGYTIRGLMQRACCTVACARVKARVELLIARANSGWRRDQDRVLLPELARNRFCDGKIQLVMPKPVHNEPRGYNPRLGPPA